MKTSHETLLHCDLIQEIKAFQLFLTSLVITTSVTAFADERSRRPRFHSDDPLWDGAGCGGVNECCSFNNPPWFYRELPTTITHNIKVKIQKKMKT